MTPVVQENAATLFQYEAPEMFCGLENLIQLSASMRVSR